MPNPLQEEKAQGIDLSDWRVIFVGLLTVWMFVGFTHYTIVGGRQKARRRQKLLNPEANKVN